MVGRTSYAASHRQIAGEFGRLQIYLPNSAEYVDLLSGSRKLFRTILFMCHGADEGIILPELDPAVAKSQPYNNFLTLTNSHSASKISTDLISIAPL